MFSTVQILGAPENQEGFKQILASCDVDDISVTKRDSIVSEEMIFLTGNYSPRLTEIYMDLLATKMDAINWERIPTGWCSWYFYYTMPDEQEMVDNTRFLAERFGDAIEWIQIDDGFQEAVGDWEENSRFASGLGELVGEIHRKGYRAGIWTAPFVASEHSDVFKDHPDWFIRDKNNLPIAVDQNPLWLGNYYALDLTNPVVIEHIKKIFQQMKKSGFEYFKIDFLYHAAHKGRRFNSNITRAEAVRKGLQAIREIVGDDLILGCGAPLGVSIGIVNMMRIGTDIATDWRYDWGGGVYECAINTITRSPMNDRLWINDPDCILVRQEDNNLTIEEVKLWLSVVAVSGGAVLLSDRMMDVSEDRLRLVDKLLPPYRKGGIPVDAHLYEEPRVFAVPVESSIGYWSIVAVVNLTEDNINVSFGLEDAGLTEEIPHHVFSFWDSEYLGLFEEEVVIEDLKPHSCRLLAVRPSSSLPTVMSTSIHFTQGAIELSNLEWSSDGKELSVKVKKETHSPESVSFVFGDEWTPLKGFINDVETDIEKLAPEIISVREIFKAGDVIRIKFDR
jgi:alpha-galactosidase